MLVQIVNTVFYIFATKSLEGSHNGTTSFRQFCEQKINIWCINRPLFSRYNLFNHQYNFSARLSLLGGTVKSILTPFPQLFSSVYPRNKKGHGNFIKKGTSTWQALAEWSKRALYARWGIKKGHIYCPPSPPHPHTHTKEILIFPVYLLSLLPSQSNIPSFVPSNGCPF